MWKRRDRDEDSASKAYSTPASEPAREGIPLATSSMPVRNYEPETPRGVATIGKAVYIKGQIVAREDLIVDGTIEGTIEANEHRCTVGPNGKVSATIKARHIIIQGQVSGNVDGSEKVEIRNGARLVGDVRTVKFVCEEDGFLTGAVSSLRTEPRAAAPAAEPAKEKPAAPAAQQSLSASASDSKR